MIGLRIAVRNEAVALRHGAWFADLIRERNLVAGVELVPQSTGLARDGAVRIPGRDGVTTAALWEALRDDVADVAWLDLRELPQVMPEDIRVVAWTDRLNPRAGFVKREETPSKGLPRGITIATTDAVVKSQIAANRKDIVWTTLSGDLPTRLHKIHLRQADGVVDAAADLLILGFSEDAIEFMSTQEVLPAPCQGIWGICVRADRDDLSGLFAQFDNEKSRLCGSLERHVVTALDPKPDTPVGVRVRTQRQKVVLDAAAVPISTGKVVRLSVSGAPKSGEDLAAALAEMMRQRGIGRTT